jgi:phosphoserine phosphatase
MTVKDTQRGRVIGAAWHLNEFLRANAGPTTDWPVRIVVDDDAKAEELVQLLAALNRELGLLGERPDE